MTRRIRRNSEVVRLSNERHFPYVVELALPLGPFRSVFPKIDAFRSDRRIPVRRGRSRHEVKSIFDFNFPDTATAGIFPQSLRWRVLDLRNRRYDPNSAWSRRPR